jgi:hypothetical protein
MAKKCSDQDQAIRNRSSQTIDSCCEIVIARGNVWLGVHT